MAANVLTPSRFPGALTLDHAVKLAHNEDKPILMDYWYDSLTARAFIGFETEAKIKKLVKSEDEYTSPISKIFQVGGPTKETLDFIIMTENSIYLVAGQIGKRELIKGRS